MADVNTTSNIIQLFREAQQQEALPIGQVVAYSDRANPRQCAVVIANGQGDIYGQTCIFEDGHRSQVRRASIEGPGGWEMVPQVMTDAEIAAWVAQADAARVAAKAEAEREAAEAKDAHAKETARLLVEYPKLERVSNEKPARVVAAGNIRKLLKARFPLCKFTVTSKVFSGGDSIDIGWTDGPTTAEVEEITERFSGGSFNGMDDSYTYSSSAWTHLFGDAKYVSAQRSVSNERMRQVADEMGFADKAIKWGEIEGADWHTNQAFRKGYYGRSFYAEPEAKLAPVAVAEYAPVLCW
jgi:hypothetical protein